MKPTHYHKILKQAVDYRYTENGYVYFSWSNLPTMVVSVGEEAWGEDTIPLDPIIKIHV